MRSSINNLLGIGIGAMLAGSGIASLLRGPSKEDPLSIPYEWVAGNLVPIFLGIVMLGYYQLKYRGGLYTGLGAVFASMALFDVGDFLQKVHNNQKLHAEAEVVLFALLVVTSVLLLAAGHSRHKRLRSKSSALRGPHRRTG